MATYDFDVQYRPGKANTDADLLSCNIAEPAEGDEWESMSPTAVKSVCWWVQVGETSDESPRYVEQLGAPPACIPDVYAFPSQLHLSSQEQFSKADLMETQRRDNVLEPVIEAVKNGVWPSRKDMSPEMQLLKRESGRLVMRDGLLCRVGKKSGDETLPLVLPGEFCGKVLYALHDDMRHLGVERVTDLLRARFYWPKMLNDVEDYVKNCGWCVTHKTPCKKVAP